MCVPGCEDTVMRALSRRGFFKGAGAMAATTSFAAAAVAPEPARAATFTRVVDLTHTMSPDFPTFFGAPGIEMQREKELKKDGYNLFWWRINEHAGTHMDAPIHFSADGASVEKLAVTDLVAPLAVIDISKRAAGDPDTVVTRDDLAAWEKAHGRLPNGCCVAMQSGWAQHLGNEKFTGRDVDGTFHFPGFGIEAVQWLMKERRVTGIAVDTMSLDNGKSKDFKVHYAWLPSGRWGLENVANLDKVPPVGATLVVGIPKVKDATGGTARLIALV